METFASLRLGFGRHVTEVLARMSALDLCNDRAAVEELNSSPFEGSLKGGIDIGMGIDIDMDIDSDIATSKVNLYYHHRLLQKGF